MSKNGLARWGRAALLLSLCVGLASCDVARSDDARARADAPQFPNIPPPPAGPTDEMAVRDQVVNQTWALLEIRDFAGVDRLAKTYLDRRERTPSGVFKAAYVYYTIQDYLQDGGRAPCSEQRRPYVEDWIKAAPRSPPAIVAYAQYYVLQGLCARGFEPADKVDPDALAIFRADIQVAAAALQNNKAVGAKDPQWYALMQEIAAYQRWDEPKFAALHAEAVSKFGWDYQIYFGAGRYYLPRWGGSLEAFDQFARRSAERTRATDGAGLYVRIYWYAMQEDELYHDLKHYSRADLNLLQSSMRDVDVRYPSPWNYNNFAWILCRNEMFGEAKTYFDKITDPPSYPPWPSPGIFQACKTTAERTAPSV